MKNLTFKLLIITALILSIYGSIKTAQYFNHYFEVQKIERQKHYTPDSNYKK